MQPENGVKNRRGDEPPDPRWQVTLSAVASTVLGAFVIVVETLSDGPERPILLGIAYALLTGGPALAFLERFRRP